MSDRRGDTPIRILANRAAGSIGIPARDFHRGPEHEVFCTEGPKIRMQSDYRAVSTRQHILTGGVQIRILPGAPFLSESFEKRRVRASVLRRQRPPETISFRVADRVAEVFAWQTAWHHSASFQDLMQAEG